MVHMREALLIPVLGFLLVQPAAPPPAASADAPAAAAMRWRLVGPFRGGRVVTAAGVKDRPNLYYFGAVGGGVWKTTNAGLTWTPIFDAQPVQSIGALAIATSNPDIIYVGTGEPDFRSDLSSGNGMYKSTDAGQTWQPIGLEETRQIARISIDPRNPDIVLVAALGHAYGPNEQRGVFRTTDGGHTWQKVLYRNEDVGAVDVVRQPSNPDVVYAALWSTRRTPWSRYPPLNGAGGGIFKSTDAGVTWTEISGHGLPSSSPTLGRIGLAVGYGNHGNRVYAIIEAEHDASGLYRSDDAGATWQRVGTDPRITSRMWYFSEVIVDPTNADIVYAPNVGLNKSTDGGRTWTSIKGAPGGDDYHSLWIDPDDPGRMISGVDQGTTISVDGGRSWTPWYNQATAQFYHVAVDNGFPYRIYGAQQDSGTVGITSRGDYGAILPSDWHPVAGGESGYVVPDPDDPDIVYGGNTMGELHRYTRATGQMQNISPSPESGFGADRSKVTYRFTWTSPIAFGARKPANGGPRPIYFGSQYVLKSSDGGRSWTRISPDLSRGGRDVVPPTGGRMVQDLAAAEGYGVVYTIAPSAAGPGVIWAGTDDGLVHVTRDAGKSWTNVTPKDLGPWDKISLIDASPHDAATAYIAVDRHRLDDQTPIAYRTHDYGATWTKIASGLPDGAFVRAVREDSVRKGLLFAGTERGVFVSFDDGGAWAPLQMNLPHAPIHDLVVHDNDVVVATHGRSFWVLDDISPLRQWQSAPSAATLFDPAAAIRIRRSVNNDTPKPPEVPMGTNPPNGAVIDYWLPRAGARVDVEVTDASGATVRRFSSADVVPPIDMTTQFPSYWLGPEKMPSANAGMNRFVWDLRYPSPPSVSSDYTIAALPGDTPLLPLGPAVVPGTYRVTLTVDGASQTKPLVVKMDPRVSASSSDLAAQLELEQKIAAAMTSTSQALKSAPTEDQRSSARRLNAALSQLLNVVDSADAAPTQQARELFARLSAELARGQV